MFLVFKLRAPLKSASEAACVSHHAVVVDVVGVRVGAGPPPPKGFLTISHDSKTFSLFFFQIFFFFFAPKKFFSFISSHVFLHKIFHFSFALSFHFCISGCFRPFGTIFKHGSKKVFVKIFFSCWPFLDVLCCLQIFSTGSKKNLCQKNPKFLFICSHIFSPFCRTCACGFNADKRTCLRHVLTDRDHLRIMSTFSDMFDLSSRC